MAESTPTGGVRVVGIVLAVLGAVFLVAGVVTYATVSSTLADQHITVSDDAAHFAGKQVKGATFQEGEPVTVDAERDLRMNLLAVKIEAKPKTEEQKP